MDFHIDAYTGPLILWCDPCGTHYEEENAPQHADCGDDNAMLNCGNTCADGGKRCIMHGVCDCSEEYPGLVCEKCKQRKGKAHRLPTIESIPDEHKLSYQHGRFRVVGGDSAYGPRPPATAWCVMTIQTSGFVSCYGGEVWPSAWPALFQKLRGSAQVGSGGFVLTPLGREMFDLGPQCPNCPEQAHYEPRAVPGAGWTCKGSK